MKTKWMRVAPVAAAALVAMSGCATKKGFEQPGFAFGCPIGEDKIGSMDDLVRAKVATEGRRTTIQPTEMRCSKAGDLIKVDANLNNDSKSVKRIAYKFRWIDREGMRAAEEESWKPVMLYENSNMMISTVAPNPKAVDFRLILMSQE
ncbi:MAG TPA: YcfL family protein [Burkholderiales bacterium]|nr:YcfL family protein [Burkholderiales bacterium]